MLKYDYSHLIDCRDWTRHDIVGWACDEVGDRTSIAQLMEVVYLIWDVIEPNSGCTPSTGGDLKDCYDWFVNGRLKWRRKNKSTVDCRTYQGQPDRNMIAA